MVGVVTTRTGDFPSGLPLHLILIHQEAHKLCNRDGRVRIVELDSVKLGEVLPVIVTVKETADDVLQGATYEEVLLNEAQFLAVLGGIIGIKDLGDGFADRFFAHRLDIAAGIEGFEVEFL